MSDVDVAVVGLGPAGRALAHRLLAAGARVLAVDPDPGRVWEPTYGGWTAQLPDWLPSGVVGARSGRTLLVAARDHVLTEEYAVLDNAALHAACSLDGARLDRRIVSQAEMSSLAPVVVDARGARHTAETGGRPLQTAYGVRLPAGVAAPLPGDAQAVLMDWRPFDGAHRWGARPPSFCYVVPLPDGRVLAEETILAATPAVDPAVLAERLRVRLRLQGVDAGPWFDDAEEVRIPMLPPPATGDLPRFGSVGDELNPMTGYSVFASLAAADDAARSLLQTGRLPARPHLAPRRLALQALLGLPPDRLVDLFEAFGRLSPAERHAVFDPHATAPVVLRALFRQWARMGARGRFALVTATVRGARR